MAEAVIYGLTDPRTGEVRYIGKANDAAKRLKGHLRECRRRRTPLYAWMNKLAAGGLKPGLVELERADDWREAERRLIAEARARGDRLLNVADGGDEPHCPRDVRANNGRNVAKAINADPVRKFIRDAKRDIATALRQGHVANRTRVKLREAAVLRPDLFGQWLNLPDREENEDGSPVALLGLTG